MSKIKIRVDGMMCEKCTGKVHDALMALEGVKSVEVDQDRGLAVAVYEGDISDETFAMAVIDAGFKAKVKHGLF